MAPRARKIPLHFVYRDFKDRLSGFGSGLDTRPQKTPVRERREWIGVFLPRAAR